MANSHMRRGILTRCFAILQKLHALSLRGLLCAGCWGRLEERLGDMEKMG